jgi:hypothetical protein
LPGPVGAEDEVADGVIADLLYGQRVAHRVLDVRLVDVVTERGSHRAPAPPGTRTPSVRLYVTEGVGLVQSRGDEVIVVQAGDVIRTPPGEEHWHGERS